MRGTTIAFFILMAVAGVSARASADDASSLNARVCSNVSLSERDRSACTKAMTAAKTDDDRAKVRKEFEAKIQEARARKSGM
jgi:outer membrane murein-binding lipoprotein Lpp